MHAVIHLLQLLIRKLGLPEWTIFIVIVPILLVIGVGVVLVRRKYFQVLRRKLKPYNGTLRHGLCFWAPTAYFDVDGIPGELPWVSIFNVTRIRFPRLPVAGRLLIDSRGISESRRRSFKGEPLAFTDKIFSNRFQILAAPGSFGESFLDPETRKRVIALLLMSRSVLTRGEEGSSTKGWLRIDIDGKRMDIALKGLLGTPEAGDLLAHAAELVRRLTRLSQR